MAKLTFDQRVAAGIKTMIVGNVYDPAKANALAKSVKTRAENLDVDIHVLLVASIGVAMDHSNTNVARDALNSLGLHTRAKSAAEWLERYSNCECTLDKKAGWKVKLVVEAERKDRTALEDLMVKAVADPFWTVPEKTATSFDLHTALRALLKKAETAKGKGTLGETEQDIVAKIASMADLIQPVKPANDAPTSEAPKADPMEVAA